MRQRIREQDLERAKRAFGVLRCIFVALLPLALVFLAANTREWTIVDYRIVPNMDPNARPYTIKQWGPYNPGACSEPRRKWQVNKEIPRLLELKRHMRMHSPKTVDITTASDFCSDTDAIYWTREDKFMMNAEIINHSEDEHTMWCMDKVHGETVTTKRFGWVGVRYYDDDFSWIEAHIYKVRDSCLIQGNVLTPVVPLPKAVKSVKSAGATLANDSDS